MGWGDEIMAAGDAQVLYDEAPQEGPVNILDRAGRIRQHVIWDNNPVIEQKRKMMRSITNGVGRRPYCKAPFRNDEGWLWTDWKASEHRGKIWLSETEKQRGMEFRDLLGAFVVLEPNKKRQSTVNKHWSFEKYQKLVNLIPLPIVQLGESDSPTLDRVDRVYTHTFRDMCAILGSAALYIGSEGGSQHAATALGIPAVVMFGGSISVENVGYPENSNIRDPSNHAPCGSFQSCPKCQDFLAAYSVEAYHAVIMEKIESLGLN